MLSSSDDGVQPPFGDVDDRIRYIATQLGLRTVVWQFDSNDWRVGTGNITAATVDGNYQALIQRQQNGTFSTVSSFLSSSVRPDSLGETGWHDHAHTRIEQLYDVGSNQILFAAQVGVPLPRSHRRCAERQPAVCGIRTAVAKLSTMYCRRRIHVCLMSLITTTFTRHEWHHGALVLSTRCNG